MILLNTSRAACLALFSAAVIFISSSAAFAATITVTGTGDTIAVDGVVTLREAITSANNNANVNTDVVAVGVYGTDTINFNIPGTGVHTISPGSALPDITDPVTIDGYMQPGASVNTLAVGDNAVILIELDGSSAGAGASGLVITAGSSTVRGLVINRFNSGGGGESGITLQTGGGNTITGNFIGTDPAGTVAQPNLSGLDILSSPNNIIGGITVGARNLVSANINEQLLIDGSSASGNQVQGNYIGTNAAGSGSLMTAASNRGQGITLRAPSNTIGGTAAGAGNLISGNGNEGIFINIANSNIIQGNLIGTDGNGTAANTNGLGGIDGVGAINTGGGTNNIIGGTDPGSRNVISGNVGPSIEEGILLEGSGNTAQGNFIGVDVTGNVALGNAGAGILAQGGSSNLVGGTATGAGNRIAFNKSGVEIRGTGTGNAVLSNSIFSNSPGLGIDLYTGFVPNGVTPNDACDGDSGPNNFQNFPVISSVVSDNSTMTITGTLNSTASTVFRIEFFASPDCDPSGNGEGKTFVGSTVVTTDTTCNATISFNAPVGDLGGQFITATATDPQNNTSEFSPCECTPPSDRQLVNISSRASVGTGDNVAIGGFIIHSDSSTTTRLTNGTGVPTKRVLIRGIGPSLRAGGNPLNGRLLDPVVDLYDSNGTRIDHNDNWMEEPDGVNNPARTAAIQATGLAPTDPAEAALLETLNVDSAHTAILSGKSNTTGIGLVEIYDLEATSTTHLANLSTRAFVSTGDDVLIGGFIGQGCASARVLLRAIGPSLTAYNISNALVDPVLELHDANGALVDTNDDWMNSPNKTDIIATGLAPSNDKESAILFTPAPGAYTGVVLGKDPTPTGVGLVEAYNLGP